MFILQSGDMKLPAPVSMKINDEIIWSSDTGRTLNAYMIGEAIAEKKTISLQWSFLTEQEIVLIKSIMTVGFFPITFRDDGNLITMDSYRGTLSKEVMGDIGDGYYWYKSANVDVVQR